MESSGKQKRRLLMNFEQNVREINRAVINPVIDTIGLSELEPVMKMVAHARADYLQALFALAEETKGGSAPTDVTALRSAREHCDELIEAVSSLETMIERGYIDVSDR